MKYYKLSMDMERENDIICHFQNDYGIQQNALNTGKVFENWDDRFEFFYTKEEGDVWTDYLANDKGWFLVSNRLKTLLESVNTDIQFLKVGIKEINNGEDFKQYYIANIIKVVDALCLDKSEYFETEIEGIGTIYTVSKYGIYADRHYKTLKKLIKEYGKSNKQIAEDIIEFTSTPECRMVEKYGDKPEFYGYGQDKCFVFINFIKNYGSL